MSIELPVIVAGGGIGGITAALALTRQGYTVLVLEQVPQLGEIGAGILMNTSQSSMPALAAAYYPTQGRATGVAWMLGIARFGGIAGSFLVAEMSRQHLELASIFAVIAIPGLVACAAVLIKNAARPQAATAYGNALGNPHVH